MSAKDDFLLRLRSLNDSLLLDAVIDKALTEVKHNQTARLMRNGLAVVGFAALEDFVKKRTSEILSEIGRTGVTFNRLPQALRYAVTFGVLSALTQQLSYREPEDRVTFIQEQSLKISSTANAAYELSEYAFGYSASNVKESDIYDSLRALGVADPWGNMTRIASRIGFVGLPLRNSFLNASKRRHKAAHVAHADTPNFDLQQYVKEASAIAIGFDCLASKCLSFLKSHDVTYLDGTKAVGSNDVKFRTIKKEGGLWKEYKEGTVRAYRANIDLEVLKADAIRRSVGNLETLVFFDDTSLVSDWVCH